MIEVLTSLLGVTLAVAVFTVLGSAIFGLSIWVYVPIKESPFADGVVKGIKKCTVFSLAIGLIGFGLLYFIGIFGAVAALIIYFIGMKRVFNCGIFDTIVIGIINYVIQHGIGAILGKLFS